MTSKFVKTSLAALALLAIPFAASAADMPVKNYYKGAPRSVMSYYNWSGLYVGAVVGYGFGSSTWSPSGLSISPKGMMYGATLGYNWQMGSFVYGLEGDYSISSVKGSVACLAFSCETSNTSLGTVRGRIGYAMDRFLPYFTAGAAFGNIKASTTAGNGDSASKIGWALGG